MISPIFSWSEMWHRQKWKAWLQWVPRHDHALQGAEAAAGGQEPGWREDQKGRHAQQKVQISSNSSPKIIPGLTSTKPLNLNGWHNLSFCFIFMKFRMESICEQIFCAHFYQASSPLLGHFFSYMPWYDSIFHQWSNGAWYITPYDERPAGSASCVDNY